MCTVETGSAVLLKKKERERERTTDKHLDTIACLTFSVFPFLPQKRKLFTLSHPQELKAHS